MAGMRNEYSRSIEMKARGPDEVVHTRMYEFGQRSTSKHRKVVERTHFILNLALVFVMKGVKLIMQTVQTLGQ